MRRTLFTLLIALTIHTLPASAAPLDLDTAKANGVVGEQSDGYLGSVEPSADASALVSSINKQRRAKYLEIAQKNGTSLSDVETLAGKKAIEMTAPGGYIRLGAGGWKKK